MSQNKEVLVNRVANSGLITINLEDHYPKAEVIDFDLKDYLFMELMLKEKDFRAALKEVSWEDMKDKVLCVFCSTDAIIPQWAYMLVATYATPYAQDVVQMTQKEWTTQALVRAIQNEDYTSYEGKRVVVKGCGDKDVGPAAYLEVAKQLQPFAQSIMFGEPCSTVPIFKRPRILKK